MRGLHRGPGKLRGHPGGLRHYVLDALPAMGSRPLHAVHARVVAAAAAT